MYHMLNFDLQDLTDRQGQHLPQFWASPTDRRGQHLPQFWASPTNRRGQHLPQIWASPTDRRGQHLRNQTLLEDKRDDFNFPIVNFPLI